MSSFKDLVKKANAGKQTTKKKEEDKNHSSFVDLVKKANANIKSNLTEDEVAKWSNSVGDIGKRAYNYLSTDGYKKVDTALAEEINKYIEDSHSISQYLRANKSKFKNYDEIYNGYIEQVNYLKDLQKSITDSNEYFSKFKTEKEYEDHKIGWLNPEAETNAETASARQERYRQNEASLKQMEEDLPWYAATIMPDFMENWFLSDEDEKKKVEYETLKAENNQYKRTQSVLDEYYTPETPEFLANGAVRNYTNASKEDIKKYDNTYYNINQLLMDGSHYQDENGNIINRYSNEVVYTADDLSRAIYNESKSDPLNGGIFDDDESDNYVDQFFNNLVQDKLGMYLSASEEDIEEAIARTTSNHSPNVKTTWSSALVEGEYNAWKQLTEYELNIYYNLYKTQGQAAAYEYLDKMTTELTRRETVARQKKIDEASGLEQIALNIASVPMNFLGGASSLAEKGINLITGEENNPYSQANAFLNDAAAIRTSTAKDINEATGNIALPWLGTTFGDVYQAGMSILDSVTGGVAGKTFHSISTFSRSAATEMNELWKKGADTGQMFAGGILAGAAELTFERYSFDKLMKLGDSKTIRQVIINGLKQGGVEATEEMFTEIANTITNSIVMGSQSDWVDAETFVKSVLNSGLSGFISGGTMGGTVSAINYAVNKSQFKKAGADIIEQGATEELLNLANEMAGVTGDKTLFKYSDKAAVATKKDLGSRKSALEVGRASALLQDNITEQNRGEIESALIDKGLKKKDAKRVAEYLASTNELTEEQIDEVKGNETIKAVAKELLGDPDSKINERQKKYIAAKLGVKYETPNLSDTAIKSGDIAVNTEVDVKDKVSADGKTVQVSTGEAITINKDNAIAKIETVDGERVVYLNTDKGVVASNDVNYANESEALVYESFVDMNPAYANAVIKNYDGKVPIQTYINGMREGIILYGMHNFQGVGKDISESTYFAELSAEDQAFALKLGSAYADMVAEKEGKALRTAIKNAAEQPEGNKTSTNATPKKGGVRFEGGVVAKGKLQKRTVSLAKHLARAIGIDIVFYDARTTTDPNGQGSNGYFNEDTNTIHLDLQNAQNDAKTIAFTLSHELVHFINKWSPEKFNTFSKFLMENYAKHGVNTSQLLANKMADLGTKDADLAYEEMIADACETMLLDSNAVYKLMELRKADLELFEKIKLHIHELLNKLRNMYKELGLQPTSDEAKALLGMTDVLEQMYSLFEEASVDAVQTYRAAQNANETIFGEQTVDAAKNSFGVDNEGNVIKGGFVDKGGYMGGWYRQGVDVNQEVMAVSEDIKAGKSSLDVDYGMSKAAKEKAEERYKPSVKKQLKKDSQGNVLSEGQIEYFKDSKVRDADGNLLVAYHGTPNDMFYVFDPSKQGSTTDAGALGKGFYFSDEKASYYWNGVTNAKNSLVCYLNIKKPFMLDEKVPDDFKEYVMSSDKYKNSNQRKKDWLSDRDKAHTWYNFFKVPSWENYGAEHTDVNAILKELGYDGIMHSDNSEIVIFDSNQAKLTTNKSPATNPDIRYQKKRDSSSYAPTFYSQMGKVVEGIKMEKIGADSVVNFLKGKGVKKDEIKWSGIETFLEGKKSVTKQELLDFINASSLQIEEETLGKSFFGLKDNTKWRQYTLDGGSNYREVLFKLPGSTYTNDAMSVHWDEERTGVLVHARIQDFNVDGKKMLFIEELQSDWHNEGQKSGYQEGDIIEEKSQSEKENAIDDIMEEIDVAFSDFYDTLKGFMKKRKKNIRVKEAEEIFYNEVSPDSFFQDYDLSQEEVEYVQTEVEKQKARAEKMWDYQAEETVQKAPDAPFKDTYHEYVLKRLIRMAAENGYNSIGWTPAEIQDERWVNENPNVQGKGKSGFLEGYRIEYDQDIPKFLKKYGKQWGATVGSTVLNNGTEVWSMDITEPMEQAVLYEGQAKFQKKKVSNRTILANALESAIDTSTQAGQNELQWLREYQGKIDLIEKEEAKLAEINAEIKAISFGKGTDRSKLTELRQKKAKASNRITIYDRQLLRLEATKPIRDILAREREIVRKRTEAKGREALAEFRRESIKVRNQMIGEARRETRQKISESRSRTEMRHKIKKVVADLSRILNRGTKERNVKLSLQDAVGKALMSAEVLFSNEITNADIVRLGVESVTPAEEKALEKYAQLLDQLDKAEDEAEIKRIKGSLSGYDSRYKDLFVRERARLNNARVSDALTSLANAYADLKNSTDDYVKNNAYVEGMYEKIVNLSNDLQGVTIRDMSYWELKMVYDMYAMVKHMVQQANSIFREGKYEDLMTNISNVQMELDEISTSTKDPTEFKEKIADFLRGFTWNELKPYAAFERLGSQTFQKLFWDVVEADNVWARDIEEAKNVIESARKKHGFKKWDTQKAVTIKSANGLDFKLTLEDMMSIYAYSKRPQAEDHMTVGGFVFDTGSTYKDKKGKFTKTYKHKKLSETYRVDHEVIQSVMKELAKVPGAMQYVDEVQGYLTKLGEKGNEVSRVMYGIDLFKEEVYFPLQSAADYRSSVEQTLNATQTTASLKNIGMSKETVPKASNPIVLKSFDNVALDHINQMAKYHAYVVPIENLSKVFNNVNKGSGEYISTQALISSKFGESAKRYFNQFITDLNGGSLNGGASNPLANMFATSKAVSVGANLSVVVQQYFAIVRALDEMNPKYFIPFLNGEASKSNEKQYEELKKYAPVGIIKQIGGFDMGANRSALDYIGDVETRLDSKKVRRKVKDAAMWLPGKMDEIGWSTIWRAVKKEIADTTNHKVGTKEFFEACGKRFTEIVAKTQVYDSVTSRSGYMRSKHETVKYLTSFMGEPTAIVNKMFTRQLELHRAIKSKDKSRIKAASAGIARTSTVLILSTVLTSLAKSLPYAMRDDDEEDKALLERWAKHFGEATFSDMNPLNMLPVGRDLVSIWEGWDVERPDTTLISDIFTTFKKAMDDGCTAEEAMDLAGSLANILGYPLKNVIRDVKGVVRLVGDIADDITPTDIGGAFGEGFIGEDKSKDDRLYDAVVNGDTARIDVLKANYDTDSKYNTALAKAIVANDSEIVGVASDYINEEFSSYDSKVDELIALGFTPDSAVKAIKKVVGLVEDAAQAEADGDTETYDEKVQELLDLGYDESQLMADIEYLDAEPSDDTEKAKSRWNKDNYVAAVTNGDTTMAEIIKADLIETDIQNGKTEEEAEKSLDNALNRGYKEDFFNGDMSESEVEDWIRELYPDKTDSDVYWEVKKWKKEKEHQDDPDYSYSKYGEYYEAVLNGDIRTMNAFKFEMQQHNNYDKNVNKQVASTMQSAITSHFKPIYKAASPYERASLKAKILAAYTSLGYAYGKMSVKIDKWLTED